jgi:AmiR/NasT family two-component response regulator
VRAVDGQHLDGHSHDGQLSPGPARDRVRAAEEISRLEETLATAEKGLEDLQTAVQSNRRIGMAIGILMALRKISEEDAFDALRRASSVRNVKLRFLAEEVIRTGTID